MDALLSVSVGYRWALTLAFAAFVVGLSVTPGLERPDDNLFSWLFANTAPLAQKILHVVTYAILAALWMWTLVAIDSLPTRISLSLLLTLGLGVALELFQTTIPGRFGTITDILLNTIGTVLGLVVAAFLL